MRGSARSMMPTMRRVRVDEEHVQRDERVAHPEALHFVLAGKMKSMPFPAAQLLAPHQAARARVRRGGDLHLHAVRAAVGVLAGAPSARGSGGIT